MECIEGKPRAVSGKSKAGRALAACIAMTFSSLLTACGGPSSAISGVGAPASLNIYPVARTSENPARLFIVVTAVGSRTIRLPLAFDTGSAGITLNALSIFPSSMVTSNGFVFPQGATELTYRGITVTTNHGSRSYGGQTGRTEIGNLGFATVTFGDGINSVKTRVMPIFLYYSVQLNSTNAVASLQQQQGWFGVNDTANLVNIFGSQPSSSGTPECASGVTESCYVVSALKYVDYANGIDAGFLLAPSALESCDITVQGACKPSPTLTVGITPALENAFDAISLNCPPSAQSYSGPPRIAGYAVCDPAVGSALITDTGSPGGSFSGPLLFDTGTPYIVLNVPIGVTFPQMISTGSEVDMTLSDGFQYSVIVGGGIDSAFVRAPSIAPTVVGLSYFATNSFFTDYATNEMGWK